MKTPAFVERTGVLDLLKRGYHHATIDLFDTRMDDHGIAAAANFQKFLIDQFGEAGEKIGGWGVKRPSDGDPAAYLSSVTTA